MAERCFQVKLCRRIGVSSTLVPGARKAGPFAQAGFVDEDDAAAFSLGFFLSAGQPCRLHRTISGSLRWLATTPAAPAGIPSPDSQVELRRGAIAMTINWPTSAAAEFAAWTEGAGEHMFLAARIERWLCGSDGCPRSWSPRCTSTRRRRPS